MINYLDLSVSNPKYTLNYPTLSHQKLTKTTINGVFLSLGIILMVAMAGVVGELAEAVGLLQVIIRCRPVGSSKKVCVLFLNT